MGARDNAGGGSEPRPGPGLARFPEDAAARPPANRSRSKTNSAKCAFTANPAAKSRSPPRFACRRAPHEEAEIYAQKVQIEVQQAGDGIRVRTIYPEEETKVAPLGKNTSYSVNYDVAMPSDAPLFIRNSFGSVTTNGVRGKSDIENSHGSLTVHDIGPARLNNSFGSIELTGASGDTFINDNNGSVEASRCKGRAGFAQSLRQHHGPADSRRGHDHWRQWRGDAERRGLREHHDLVRQRGGAQHSRRPDAPRQQRERGHFDGGRCGHHFEQLRQREFHGHQGPYGMHDQQWPGERHVRWAAAL